MVTTEECVPFPPFSTKHERGDPISFSNLNIIHEIFSAIRDTELQGHYLFLKNEVLLKYVNNTILKIVRLSTDVT